MKPLLYAKIAIARRTDERLLAVSVGARQLWLWGRLQARGEETDGLLPPGGVRAAWGEGKRQNEAWASELVRAGLWGYIEGHGWNDVTYLDDGNETLAGIEARREGTRLRVQRHRLADPEVPSVAPDVTRYSHVSNDQSNASVPISISGSDLRSDPEDGNQRPREAKSAANPPKSGLMPVARSTEPYPEPTGDDPDSNRESQYRQAYERGVAEGKSGPYAQAWPRWEVGALHLALTTFAKAGPKPLRGDKLLAWITDAAADFAADVTKSSRAHFYGGYAAEGFLRWLGEQEGRPEAAQEPR